MKYKLFRNDLSWWLHQMETFSALLAICVGNSSVTGEFPAQRPVMRIFVVFFDLRQNKRLSKQWWGWWFETPSRPLWRHCNVLNIEHGSRLLVCTFVWLYCHIEAEAKWPTLCRRQLSMSTHFLDWKLLYFDSNFNEICSQRTIVFPWSEKIDPVHARAKL